MSTLTLATVSNMPILKKASEFWACYHTFRRFISLSLRCRFKAHEPSAPKPDCHPKWTTSPAEIFDELGDGMIFGIFY